MPGVQGDAKDFFEVATEEKIMGDVFGGGLGL